MEPVAQGETMAWNPDGDRLALYVDRDGVEIWSVEGKLLSKFQVLGVTRSALAWSPDGQRLAVSAGEGSAPVVKIFSAAGKEERTLPPRFEGCRATAPTRRWLGAPRARSPPACRRPATSFELGMPRPASRNGPSSAPPATACATIAPDGRIIECIGGKPDEQLVYVVERTGGRLELIVPSAFDKLRAAASGRRELAGSSAAPSAASVAGGIALGVRRREVVRRSAEVEIHGRYRADARTVDRAEPVRRRSRGKARILAGRQLPCRACLSCAPGRASVFPYTTARTTRRPWAQPARSRASQCMSLASSTPRSSLCSTSTARSRRKPRSQTSTSRQRCRCSIGAATRARRRAATSISSPARSATSGFRTLPVTARNSRRRRLEPDADTILLYHLDEGVGEVAHDASGHGLDGKIVAAKWVAGGCARARRPPFRKRCPTRRFTTRFPDIKTPRELAEWTLRLGGRVNAGQAGGSQ